ncbi:M48 family metallopeptidase [Deminuibacter soli]|uniref:M48 family peptidase n=1 Tax=Deminuibacter soli TaxID=2291815 RepID=A0A3E1NGY3_9BACT|nr:M48 family metallopeptidase [Deminuibacter soli]RFM27195.1 M48 family peptidase [Deminuibacter soli]
MTRNLAIAAVAAATLTFAGCTRNAITGRSQLSLVSESEMQSMALTQYQQFLTQNKVVSASSSKDAEMVVRVGNRIANAITTYYQQKGASDILKGYKWEFNLVDSKEVNAWCMPGGKVVVYTGLLPVTRDEASLAIVLGHEITHAVAGHGRERMSQQMVAQGLGSLGGVALGGNPQAASIFNSVYAPSAQVGVLLPNSRKQESEADHYGLIFAAMAGYNPQVAIAFWERMASLGGDKPPVMLSDHPSDQARIDNIKKLMPEALTYYKPVSH